MDKTKEDLVKDKKEIENELFKLHHGIRRDQADDLLNYMYHEPKLKFHDPFWGDTETSLRRKFELNYEEHEKHNKKIAELENSILNMKFWFGISYLMFFFIIFILFIY